MKKIKYIPYQGGGDPTKEQRNANTLYLAKWLDKLSIKYKKDMEYWDPDSKDEVCLKIKTPNKKVIYVGYDRWGFVVEGVYESAMDQASLVHTLNWIVKIFIEHKELSHENAN